MAKILIVEDDRATAMLLAIFTKALSHETQIADNGAAALQLLRREPHDLIISDVMMSPMDGFELLMELRREKIATPVVMISGHANTETVERARQLGAVDFLSKPLRPEHIRRCVDSALGRPVVAESAAPRVQPVDLDQLLPGPAYAPARQALLRMAERPRALLEADQGMISAELLACVHAAGPMREGPVVFHHFGKITTEEAVAGLVGEKASPGPWFKSAVGGTLALIAVERLALPVQRQLADLLGKHPGGHIIVNTLRDPDALVNEGLLDEGLLFRLSACTLRLPPLRELEPGIVAMFKTLISRAPGYVFGSVELLVEEAVARALRAYEWPENMAELRQTAATTAARLRSPHVTMAQLPDHFFKVRMPTLAEALLAAQTEHLLRATRIYGSALEVAEVLGLTADQVAAASATRAPLFHLGPLPPPPPPAPEPAPVSAAPVVAAPVAPPPPPPPSVLLIIEEPVLRAAAQAGISDLGPRVRTVRDGLGALALVALLPERYDNVVLLGADGLFTSEELAAQLARFAPRVRFTALPPDHAASSLTVVDVESAVLRLYPAFAQH